MRKASSRGQQRQQRLENVLDSEYVWIVDPIDGTTNFVHGFPFFVVSIALVHRGEVIVGVVYDPSANELFVAEKGKGAYVHGNRMSVSGDEKLRESLVATGFPAEHLEALPRNLAQLQRVAPKVRNIRSSGSAALHLAYVANGRLSGFWEIGLNSWDIAAGALLVQESGGTIGDIDGTPYHIGVRNIIATNGQFTRSSVRSSKADCSTEDKCTALKAVYRLRARVYLCLGAGLQGSALAAGGFAGNCGGARRGFGHSLWGQNKLHYYQDVNVIVLEE